MAELFESIPIITVLLIALGLAGVMIYERTRIKREKESTD